MERREFISRSCSLCALAAGGLLFAGQTACSPAYKVIRSAVVNDMIYVPISIAEEPGLKLIRPAGWIYDIALQKKDGAYLALLLRCTHQNNQVLPTGSGYYCELHGSTFNNQGQVTRGPAEFALASFPVLVSGNELIIQLKSAQG